MNQNIKFTVNVHAIHMRKRVYFPQLLLLKFPSTIVSWLYCLVQNKH